MNNAAEIFKLSAGKFACGYNAYANGKTDKKARIMIIIKVLAPTAAAASLPKTRPTKIKSTVL